MKSFKSLFFTIILVSAAKADVTTRVCLADGNTPLELADPNVPWVYRDVMVATHLTIIVSSDANGMWPGEGGGGDLSIWDPNRDYGVLSGRDFNDITGDWEGSRFPEAGTGAVVWNWEDDSSSGFYLGGSNDAVAGDWFIIDYNTVAVGDCNVAFYDYSFSWDEPLYEMSFVHVPTRDFSGDGTVNFADFSVLGLYWHETDCNEPNDCSVTDIDGDGVVDEKDAVLFAEYWLERTE